MALTIGEFAFLLAIMAGLAVAAVILLADGYKLNEEVRRLKVAAGVAQNELRISDKTIERQKSAIYELMEKVKSDA